MVAARGWAGQNRVFVLHDPRKRREAEIIIDIADDGKRARAVGGWFALLFTKSLTLTFERKS